MEHKQENEMDEWMEKMSLCMTRERLDEIQRIATEGMDAWMVRRRRRDRATLVALGVCAAVAVGGAGWWLLPRQEPRQPLTACEPPLPEALQIAVEPAPAPATPSVPARRQRVRTLPAPTALPEADEAPCATALLPDDGGDPAGTPSQSYSNMLCNNSCDPDSVISRICFHCGGEEVYHG